MKKFILIFSWGTITLVTFIASFSTIQLKLSKKPLSIERRGASAISFEDQVGYFGDTHTGVKAMIEKDDARIDIVKSFLERYNSPLTPHQHFAEFIVSTADKYGVDYRLIPAIMMQESSLCKKIPEGSHNCLGFGIHSRGTLTFNTYEESIERATRELKSNYIDIGLTTPEKIMTKYTPSSPEGAWAKSVNQWIADMEYNDRQKGREEKVDADLTFYPKQISQ